MTSLFLNSLILPSFFLALIGFIFLAYAFRINKNAHVNFIRIGVLFIAQLILLVASTIITESNADNKSRIQLKGILVNKNTSIVVGEKLLDSNKTKEMSEALKSISDIEAHHSHPIDTLLIQIVYQRDTFNLTLGQDSEIPTEYWVFADKYCVNNIGRIRTPFFIDKNTNKIP
jgi:hypothetical protein